MGFRRTFGGHREAHTVFVEGRSVAARGAYINAQNLITLVRFQRIADAAGLYIFDCRRAIRAQIGNLEQAYLAGLLPIGRRPLCVSRRQSAEVPTLPRLVRQLSSPRFHICLGLAGETQEYLREFDALRLEKLILVQVEILVQLVRAKAIEQLRIDLTLEHRLLHDFRAEGATHVLATQSCLRHRFAQLVHAGDVVLLGSLQHALVDFGFYLFSEVKLFAFLQQQLFTDQNGDQLGLVGLDFGVGLLLSHSVLLQRIDALFHLTLQLRKRDDAVVDLRDHFVNDDRLAFLRARERR